MRFALALCVCLASAVARGQTNNCAPGKDCLTNSFANPKSTGYGSLPHLPDGGCTTVGRMKYASDAGYQQCLGGAWTSMGGGGGVTSTEPFTASAPLSLYDDGGTVNISTTVVEELWSAACVTCITDVNFVGPIATSDAHAFNRLQCAWETAGTAGSTSAQIQIYDVTSAAELCSCSIGACNTTARTPMTCNCAATTVAGHLTAMRFKSKGDCTAAPQVTMCTAH